MNSAVNFIFESGVSLALLSLIYILFLRKETFFVLNRIFLLAFIGFSVLLPFMHFRVYPVHAIQPIILSEVTVTPYRNLIEAVTIYGQDLSGSLTETLGSSRFIILVYLLGMLFFFVRFILRIVQVTRLIRSNPVQKSGNINFVLLKKEFSPFSFLSYVFVNPEHQKEADYQKIVAHEMEHIKQGHTFDVLLLEILTVLQWFNPFIWILKRVIRENHEFLADRAVLETGVSVCNYKKLLLDHATGFQLQIVNNFNSSLVGKRIKMISKIRSSKIANLKYVIGALSVISLVVIFACEQKEVEMPLSQMEPEEKSVRLTIVDDKLKLEGEQSYLDIIKDLLSGKNKVEIETDSVGDVYLVKSVEKEEAFDPNEPVFMVTEEMPEFPGGDDALRNYIASSVKYPEVAQEKNIQGKVHVSFVVTKYGNVANAKIARGVDTSIDKEALRVISSLPKWKPAKQRGEAVNVLYTVPINFTLD